MGGKWSRVEGERLTADDRSTPVEIRASRIEYAGQPAMLLHVRDITERREAEAGLAKFGNIVSFRLAKLRDRPAIGQ